MSELTDILRGNFVIANLGCIGDEDICLPASLARTLTLVEVDMEGGACTTERYYRKIALKVPISGVAGKRAFRRNSFAGSSSLLDPLDGVVAQFGMERYCRQIERVELECQTLPTLLRMNGLGSLDMLRTDIEGSDFDIIRSCREYLGKILMIQCELRFRPFYEAEPWFDEVVAFLAKHDYEVLDIIHIDRWKYRTPGRHRQIEGRAVWADFLFVLRPESFPALGEKLAESVAKQIILASMMNKLNYAEYLLSRFRSSLPPSWIPELVELARPRISSLLPSTRSVRRFFRPLELWLKHQIGRSEHVAIR